MTTPPPDRSVPTEQVPQTRASSARLQNSASHPSTIEDGTGRADRPPPDPGAVADPDADADADVPTTTIPSADGTPPDGITPEAPPALQSPWWRRELPVIGGTLTLFAVCLAFLIHSPTLIGPDEPFHFDRVIAAAHGDILQDPGVLHRSKAVRGAEPAYAKSQMKRGGKSWAEFDATPRELRPSLNDLGGNVRPTTDATNYLTQHPPLYYALMGGVMWLMPNADGIPADQLVFWLRLVNVLLLLPLPLLFHRAAQVMLEGSIAASRFARAAVGAAPFAAALVPGVPRIGATINNDNLGILIGAAVVYLCIRVLRGDTGMRTAVGLALLAVAASLTKLTVLLVVAAIPVAYLVRWAIDRRLPSWRVITTLMIGAALASVWMIRDQIQFGSYFPSRLAWGTRYHLVQGTPRTAKNPMDPDKFWSVIRIALPSRFWGSLGLHEPPQLPDALLLVMSGILLISFVICLVVLRGRRLVVLLPWLLGIGLLLVVLLNSYSQYSRFTALTAIQGRYAYPALLGLLLPIAIAVSVVLGRFRRWSALVVALGGLLMGGWALFLSAEYTWLHRGEQLGFDNVVRAVRTFARFFPFPFWVAALLAGIAVSAAVGGIVAAVLLAHEDRTTVDAPITPAAATPIMS